MSFRDPVFDLVVKLGSLDKDLLRFGLRRNIGEGVVDSISLFAGRFQNSRRICARVCSSAATRKAPLRRGQVAEERNRGWLAY